MNIDKQDIERIIEKLTGSPGDNCWIAVSSSAFKELKALIEPEKWEPKKYVPNWSINVEGVIRKWTKTGCTGIERLYGAEWPTQELAEIVRDMNKRNQLILQAKTEKGFGDGYYAICRTRKHEDNKWEVFSESAPQNPELTFETKAQGEKVLEMVRLNE